MKNVRDILHLIFISINKPECITKTVIECGELFCKQRKYSDEETAEIMQALAAKHTLCQFLEKMRDERLKEAEITGEYVAISLREVVRLQCDANGPLHTSRRLKDFLDCYNKPPSAQNSLFINNSDDLPAPLIQDSKCNEPHQ